MAGSVDELMSYLLDEISLCGHRGCSYERVSKFVDRFYSKITSRDVKNDNSVENNGENVQFVRPTVDERLQERAWKWLLQHPDVRCKQYQPKDTLPTAEPQGSKSLPVDVDATQIEEMTNDVPPAQPLIANQEPKTRVFVTGDRTWIALCGHPKDSSKLFDKEFELLGIIGSRREAGIIQSDLIKASGQDKRSVPKRTDVLQQKGYIEKRHVFYKGARTSRLILKRFAVSVNSQPVAGPPDAAEKAKDGDAIDVETLIRDVFTLLKRENIATLTALRTNLGFITTRRRRLFVKAIRRLEAIGCLKRVLAASGNSWRKEALFRSVRFVRDPTDKEISEFNSKLAALPDDTKDDVEGDDVDVEDRESGPASSKDATQLQELARIVPQWNPDRILVNTLQDVVQVAGSSGYTVKEIRARTFGHFLRRPFENLLAKITECPFSSQPPGLHHLAVLRDTVQSGTISLYVHYSVDGFRVRVEAGEGFWEAVAGKESGSLKGKQKGVGNDGPEKEPRQIDQFGFMVANRPVGQVKGGRSTLGQALFAAQPVDLQFSARDPTLNSLNAHGPESLLDRQRPISRREAAALKKLMDVDGASLLNAVPVASEEPEIRSYSYFEKPKGRPRKYMRGTEKFWREHFELFRAKGKRKNTMKNRVPAPADPMTVSIFAKKPVLFDYTLVQAIEKRLPVPDKPLLINQEWVDATTTVLHRAAAGIYVTPKGVTMKSLGGKDRLSRIVIIRSLKLRRPSASGLKPSFARFMTSTAAHTFAVPRASFLEDAARQCLDDLAKGPDAMSFLHNGDRGQVSSGEGSMFEAPPEVIHVPTPSPQVGRRETTPHQPKASPFEVPATKPQQGVKRRREAEEDSRPKSSHESSTATPKASKKKARLTSRNAPDSREHVSANLPPAVQSSNAAAENEVVTALAANGTLNVQREPQATTSFSPTNGQQISNAVNLPDDSDAEQADNNALVERLIQELSGSIQDKQVQPLGEEALHTKESPLPELIVETVAPEDRQGKEGMRAGSLGIIRRNILLDMIKLSGGVLPLAYHNLCPPFGQLWNKAGQSGSPDTKTLKSAIKALCQNGTAKKITFSFRNKRGTLVTKQMLVPADKLLSDPDILETQRRMIEADPLSWLPKFQTSDESPADEPLKRVSKRWSSTVDHQKVQTAESLKLQLRKELKAAKWPNKALSRAKIGTRRPSVVSTVRTRAQTGLGTRKSGHLALYATANPTTVPVVWTQEQLNSRPTSLDDILNRMTGRKWSLRLRHGSAFESFSQGVDKVAAWEKGSTPSFDAASEDYQFINHRVDRDFPEKASIELPTKFEGLIWFDARGKEHTETKFHPSALVTAGLAEPSDEESSPTPTRQSRKRKAPPLDGISKLLLQDPSRPVRKRRRTAQTAVGDEEAATGSGEVDETFRPQPLNRGSAPRKRGSHLLDGPDRRASYIRPGTAPETHTRFMIDVNGENVDVSHLLHPKYKRPRGPQFLRKLDDDLKIKLITAVVVVRTLAGGLEKSISWDLVHRVFPDADELTLRNRFKSLANNNRRDVAMRQETFQERFPAAYARGEVGVVNFDDLDSVDWSSLVSWALKNLDAPPERDSGELPATKRRLDDLVNTKLEPAGKHYRDMFLYNQGVTISMKEQATLDIPFAVPVNISSSSSSHTPHLPDAADEPDDSHSRLARSWALASISTPRSHYDSEQATIKLRSLAPTTGQSEALISTALKSLLATKVVAKVRTEHNMAGEGRRFVLSRIFHDAFSERRTINSKLLIQASVYKLQTLDRAFQAGERVLFDPIAAEDGDMVAILNLLARDRISLHAGPDLPNNRWGLDTSKHGRSRTVAKELLVFSIAISHKPATYVFGNPLRPGTSTEPNLNPNLNPNPNTVPSPPLPTLPILSAPTLGTSPHDPIPIWRHINGSLDREKFEMALSAVLGVLATRPGASVSELDKSLKVALGGWEIECLLEWGRRWGVVGRVGESEWGREVEGEEGGKKGLMGWTGGWEVGEWWWMALGRSGAGEE